MSLPDQPSIAVLAFDNMSGDPEQEYFSDGISEDIITDLSKLSGLFVIARNASFSYKGKTVPPRQVGSEMGVRYLLEGSVRKAGERVRITAQLIEAESGKHLWAERYDRTLEDIFAVQDEITSEIVTALDVQLVSGEQARIWRKSLKNPQARDAFYKATAAFLTIRPETVPLNTELFRQVVDLEPDSPAGYTGLAWVAWQRAAQGWNPDIDSLTSQAIDLTQQALSLDETHAEAWMISAHAKLLQRRFDDAAAEGKKAVSLSPNSAIITAFQALLLAYLGELPETLSLMEKSKRLCPISPPWYDAIIGAAQWRLGNPEEAIFFLQQAVANIPHFIKAQCLLAAIHGSVGRLEEARSVGREILRIDPGFQLDRFFAASPYKDQEHIENYRRLLVEAGLE